MDAAPDPAFKNYGKNDGQDPSISELTEIEIHPEKINIQQNVRAVPLPDLPPAKNIGDDTATKLDIDQLAKHAAEAGLSALAGQQGPARDSLIYSGAIMLSHMGLEKNIQDAADRIRSAIDSGKALTHFQKNKLHLT